MKVTASPTPAASARFWAAAIWSGETLRPVTFAPQALACLRRLRLDPEIVNNDGGAIALGHPLGSSGSRLVVTLLRRMEAEGVERGLATMCIGVGQGAALLVEKV